jgi:hypothetical protein
MEIRQPCIQSRFAWMELGWSGRGRAASGQALGLVRTQGSARVDLSSRSRLRRPGGQATLSVTNTTGASVTVWIVLGAHAL